MPFKSKAQQRFMFATMPKTAKKWAKETSNIKALPKKKRKKKERNNCTWWNFNSFNGICFKCELYV